MQKVALRLIAQEFRRDDSLDSLGRASFRVCGKLGRPLILLAGRDAFRSLLGRAHSLAKAKFPWLAGVKVSPDGTFQFSPEAEAILSLKQGTDGGVSLIGEILGLLVVFIGETLTLRLLQEACPEAGLKNLQSGDQS